MIIIKYYPLNDPYYIRGARLLWNNYTDKEVFKLIYVDPNDIEYCSLREFDKWGRSGEIADGDWDRQELPFQEASLYAGMETSFYKSMKAHFEENIEWEETEYVQESIRRIRSGNKSWGCQSEQAIWRKCEKLDMMYKDVEKNGYKTQLECLKRKTGRNFDPKSRFTNFVKRNTVMSKDEVAVDIGRNGELLFLDGKHRLSIAKLLNVESIPVRVVIRHQKWQDLRNEIRSTGVIKGEKLRSHPDLQDLLSEERRR